MFYWDISNIVSIKYQVIMNNVMKMKSQKNTNYLRLLYIRD